MRPYGLSRGPLCVARVQQQVQQSDRPSVGGVQAVPPPMGDGPAMRWVMASPMVETSLSGSK